MFAPRSIREFVKNSWTAGLLPFPRTTHYFNLELPDPMPFYTSPDQLYESFRQLFARLEAENPAATQAVRKSKLVFRFNCTHPDACITINGRHNPVQATYGPSPLKADLEVSLSADTLHRILLGRLSLRDAMRRKAMRVKGPVWKSFALVEIFNQGKTLYPQILRQRGLLSEE